MLVGELHRDAAAERLPDDRGALGPDRDHQVAQDIGMGAEGVVVLRLVGLAVPEKIGRDHRVAPRERRKHLLPRRRASAQPVDQQQYGACSTRRVAADAVDELVAMKDDVTLLHGCHVSHRLNGRECVDRDAGGGLEGVLPSSGQCGLTHGGREGRDAVIDVAMACADLPWLVAHAAPTS